MFIFENEPLDLNELLAVVNDMKKHWVGTYLARVFISCYRGKKSPIDLRKFASLDSSNQQIFMQIINMRSFPGWSDENLYQCELRLKKIVGIR